MEKFQTSDVSINNSDTLKIPDWKIKFAEKNKTKHPKHFRVTVAIMLTLGLGSP